MSKSQKSAAEPSVTRTRRPNLRLTYVIGSLERILRRRMSEALAPLGLTLAQFTALSVLEANGQASNAQIAERSFITPQSASDERDGEPQLGQPRTGPDSRPHRAAAIDG
jgi:hypothetical protein